MKKKVHDFEFLPKAGPYSHAVEANGFLFLSGMIARDIETGITVTDDVTKGTGIALHNIKRALEAAGSSMQKVVKATVYLRNMDDFSAMNEVYKTYFPSNPPARTCIAVKDIPGNSILEIDIVALK